MKRFKCRIQYSEQNELKWRRKRIVFFFLESDNCSLDEYVSNAFSAHFIVLHKQIMLMWVFFCSTMIAWHAKNEWNWLFVVIIKWMLVLAFNFNLVCHLKQKFVMNQGNAFNSFKCFWWQINAMKFEAVHCMEIDCYSYRSLVFVAVSMSCTAPINTKWTIWRRIYWNAAMTTNFPLNLTILQFRPNLSTLNFLPLNVANVKPFSFYLNKFLQISFVASQSKLENRLKLSVSTKAKSILIGNWAVFAC